MDYETKFRLVKNNKIVGHEVHKQSNDDIDRMIIEHQHPGGLAVFIHKCPKDYIKHDRKDRFMGMHDDNGNEIYDGDIVSYRKFDKDNFATIQKKGIVIFSRPYKGAVIKWIGKEEEKRLQDICREALVFTTTLLVIGNEFEDPDLLEVENET